MSDLSEPMNRVRVMVTASSRVGCTAKHSTSDCYGLHIVLSLFHLSYV